MTRVEARQRFREAATGRRRREAEGLTSGVLDPIELARMANEFFTALPEALQPPLSVAPAAPVPPGSPVNVNPYAAVPGPTAPAFPGLFSSLAAEQPVVFPARDRGAAPTGSVPSASNPVPAVPGGVSTATPSPVPVFSFLQDARPLFVEPATEPALLNAPSGAFQQSTPTDAGFAAIPSSLIADVPPSQLAEPPRPPAPPIPGALVGLESPGISNEFFTALPEAFQPPLSAAPAAPVPPGSPVNVNPYAAVPGPTAPAFPGLLSSVASQQPALLPARDKGAAPAGNQPAASAPAPATAPAVPGVSAADSSAVPAFSFLQDARPLFTEPAAEPSLLNTPSGAFQQSTPTDAGFAAIPSSLFTDVSPSQLTESAQPPTPTVPGSFGKVDSSAFPAFSFMEEARPLFSTPPTVPGPVPAAPPAPAQLDKSVGAEDRSAIAANPFASPLDPHAPQLSGAVAHEPDYRAPASYDPLNQPRPLSPENTVPAQAPVGTRSALPDDLNLSSYSFDVEAIRRDFPILRERVHGRPLIWLDNAATTQKPQCRHRRLKIFYEHENSNIHRAAHDTGGTCHRCLRVGPRKDAPLSERRSSAKSSLFAVPPRPSTSWPRAGGDETSIRTTKSLSPGWSITPTSFRGRCCAAEKGARLRVAPVDDRGQVVLEEYEKLLGPQTRFVARPTFPMRWERSHPITDDDRGWRTATARAC